MQYLNRNKIISQVGQAWRNSRLLSLLTSPYLEILIFKKRTPSVEHYKSLQFVFVVNFTILKVSIFLYSDIENMIKLQVVIK